MQDGRQPEQSPRVTIGLPVYNGGALFGPAVESILSQDFDDFELVLADNCSTDGTVELCQKYAEADPRVRVLTSDVNRGAAWNFNRCVEAARGELFKWSAHDDLYAPTFLRHCVDALDDADDAVLAFTRAVEIDEFGAVFHEHGALNVAGGPRPAQRFRAVLFDEVYCYFVFGVIPTDVLRRTALIAPYSASDRVLLAELALHGRFVEVPDHDFLHREHRGRSMYAYADDRARMAWFDPTARQKAAMTLWAQAEGYAAALYRAGGGLDAAELARAGLALGRWCARNAGPLARQLVRRIIAELPLGRRTEAPAH